jgi:hydroxyquinol 1,2-dioxygenase
MHNIEHRARGILASAAEGGFHFKSVVVETYPIPHDGPVGRMLRSPGRHRGARCTYTS